MVTTASTSPERADRQRVHLPPLPALVVGAVHHVRHQPIRHAFTHAHTTWLVDLEDGTGLPALLSRVTDLHPEDHFEGCTSLADVRAEVLRHVVEAGVDPAPIRRVVLLAHARVLGHVFDPLSTYWCLDEAGVVVAAVLEVRNTYGGRRAYVVQPDASGRAGVEKDFLVSPFNGTDGSYAVRLRLDADRVSVWIRLEENGAPVVTAAVWGTPMPATPRAVTRFLVRSPLMTQRVSALIRWHGIRLWARRLPVRRPRSKETSA